MTAHVLRHEDSRPSPARRASRRGLFVLGWGQFWLLSGILGTLLAMFTVILFVYLLAL